MEQYYEIADFDEQETIVAIYEAVSVLMDNHISVSLPNICRATGLPPTEIYNRLHIVCTIQSHLEKQKYDANKVD